MLRDLLPFICRRLGLSTIQLGILDSLTLRLAVGQKLRKDQVAMLYADMPARDLEAVLSVFFEESPEGHLFSAEAQLLHDEMEGGTASSDASDSTNVTDEAGNPEEEAKRIRRSQKASKASKARWERERERRRQQQIEQAAEHGRPSSSEQFPGLIEEARKQQLDSPEQRKEAQEENSAILQASTEQSAHAPEHLEEPQARREHSEHAQAQTSTESVPAHPGSTSTPSSSSEYESVLPRIAPKENNEDAQGKLEANEASEHSSEKAKSSEHLSQESGPFSQASPQALTRAHVRASDLIYPISDSDPIGSDQIGNQWIEALRARGFAEGQLRKARGEFEALIRGGLSLEQLQVVADRVIANKPGDFAYAVRYLLTACTNELAAAKAGLPAMAKAPGGLVKVAPVTAPRKTEEEEVAALERFLQQGANPFCLPDQKLPAVQRLLECARDEWLMAGKAVEGISPAGKPVRDPRAAKQIKYYGVEDAKARIAKQRRN